MAGKHKPVTSKKPQAKRVVTEIAPGVRVLLDAYMKAYNEAPSGSPPP